MTAQSLSERQRGRQARRWGGAFSSRWAAAASEFASPWLAAVTAELTWGRRYLMCPPTHFDVSYAINPWMDLAVEVDRERAQRQWQALVTTYRDAGAQIELLDPRAGLPDLVFTANLGIVDAKTFIPARMRHDQRRAEPQHAERWFRARGLRARDLEALVVDVSEFLKAGGGPRCLTLALDVALGRQDSATVTVQPVAERMRIDRWLWAARFFKTRGLAAEAVKGGRVHVDGQSVKPSKEVGAGDRLEITIGQVRRHVVVLGTASRTGERGRAPVRGERRERRRARARCGRAAPVRAAGLRPRRTSDQARPPSPRCRQAGAARARLTFRRSLKQPLWPGSGAVQFVCRFPAAVM